MKQRTSIILSATLLFVFVFAAIVTVHAQAPRDCTKAPCDNYDCCYNDNSAIQCSDTFGVWYDGVCHCDWGGYNPNECATDNCQFAYCW